MLHPKPSEFFTTYYHPGPETILNLANHVAAEREVLTSHDNRQRHSSRSTPTSIAAGLPIAVNVN
jgi:hypothetical protein